MLKRLRALVIAVGLLAGTYVSAQRSWKPDRVAPPEHRAESSLPALLKGLVGLGALLIFGASGTGSFRRRRLYRDYRRYDSLPADIYQRAQQRKVDKVLLGDNPLDPFDDQVDTRPPVKKKAG